jgi:hypothetical protein
MGLFPLKGPTPDFWCIYRQIGWILCEHFVNPKNFISFSLHK